MKRMWLLDSPTAPAVGRVAVLLAPLCVLACGPDEQHSAVTAAIIDGVPATDPAVVAILDVDGALGCTGSLIAPHTVLTAAHCIPPVGRRTLSVFFGDSVSGGGVSIPVSDTRAHPSFDPQTLRHDLALFTIREEGPVPALMLDPRVLDASTVGTMFRIVGFGVTAAEADDAGDKRDGTAIVTELEALEFTASGAPSLACEGDSGGPALFDDGGDPTIFGVVSRGDAGCVERSAFARVDVAVEEFIAPHLAATSPGTAATGDLCFYEEHCAEGSCRVADDDPLLSFCSRPCSGDAECPGDMTCASSECRHPVPSPGALGGACASDEDCTSDLCYLPDSGDEAACTQGCLGAPDSCPAGFDCVAVSNLVHYCLQSSSGGGCTVAASGDNGAWFALLAVVLLIGAARGRARRHSGRKCGSSANTSGSSNRNRCGSVSSSGSAFLQASRWRA